MSSAAKIVARLRDFARRDIRHIEVPSERVQTELAAADLIEELCAALKLIADNEREAAEASRQYRRALRARKRSGKSDV